MTFADHFAVQSKL